MPSKSDRPKHSKMIMDRAYDLRLNQTQLAEKAGIEKGNLSQILNGETGLTINSEKAISTALKFNRKQRKELSTLALRHAGWKI